MTPIPPTPAVHLPRITAADRRIAQQIINYFAQYHVLPIQQHYYWHDGELVYACAIGVVNTAALMQQGDSTSSELSVYTSNRGTAARHLAVSIEYAMGIDHGFTCYPKIPNDDYSTDNTIDMPDYLHGVVVGRYVARRVHPREDVPDDDD